MARYDRLPFIDHKGDINANTAYVSENIVTTPFDTSLTLEPGVHLHWALPDALTRSYDNRTQDEETFSFPPVPTAWHIIRVVANDAAWRKSWIVESDYLHPVANGSSSGAICFPVIKGDVQSHGPPFRYMGRVIRGDGKDRLCRPNDRLRHFKSAGALTAIGHGDPTFAAFYPNCRSVFGFCDPSPPPENLDVQYYVIGWYRDHGDDFSNISPNSSVFTSLYDEAMRQRTAPNDTAHWPTFLHQAYEETFGWKIKGDGKPIPQSSLYYARIDIDSSHQARPHTQDAAVTVAMGNTATEALAAHLGHIDLQEQDIVEDRLEALTLYGDIEHLRNDTHAKFKEARHRAGFTALPGGKIYQIRKVSTNPQLTSTIPPVKTMPRSSGHDLPDDAALAHGLNALNIVQTKRHRLAADLVSLQKQTFADWYKYMLCAYPPEGQGQILPDIDESKYLINTFNLPRIETLSTEMSEAGKEVDRLHIALQKRLDIVMRQLAKTTDSTVVEFEIATVDAPRFWQPNEPVILLTGDDVKNSERHGAIGPLTCWQSEPLPMGVSLAASWLVTAIDGYIEKAAHDVKKTSHDTKVACVGFTGHNLANGIHWSPFMLEWEVTVAAIKADDNNDGSAVRSYSQHHITNHFDISLDAVDLAPHSNGAERLASPASYVGQSLLTPQVSLHLRGHMDRYLQTHLWPFYLENSDDESLKYDDDVPKAVDWFNTLPLDMRQKLRYASENSKDPSKDGSDTEPALQDDALTKWYRNTGIAAIDDFLCEILKIRAAAPHAQPSLTQSLSGFKAFCLFVETPNITNRVLSRFLRRRGSELEFNIKAKRSNAALLGQKQTMQLQIADPLAFPDDDKRSDYQDFAARVCKAVHPYNRTAPEPFFDFHPLRTGVLRLAQLRLVDTFGQISDVNNKVVSSLAVSRMLYAADQKKRPVHRTLLPPRLVQPARMNLRWLSANHGPGYPEAAAKDDVETNSHPITSPICGWIVPNNLDSSLSVFAQDGKALGYLDINGRWRATPGTSGFKPVSGITNPHLRRVVQWLKRPETVAETIVGEFQSAIDSALENIDPDGWTENESLALLMGRPIAVVRASVGFELLGKLALNPDWGLFRRALRFGTDHQTGSAMLGAVKFPVRIGAHNQLNDGVAGYWVETLDNAKTRLSDSFASPQSDGPGDQPKDPRGYSVRTSRAPDETGNPFCLNLTLEGPAKTLTLLIDPRGKLHATSGILPTKSITVPVDQYRDALKKIEICFLSAPILTAKIPQTDDGLSITLPRPDVPGYAWFWRECRAPGNPDDDTPPYWLETDDLRNPSPDARLSGKNCLREGWLVLRKAPDIDPNTPAPPINERPRSRRLP